MFRLSDWSIWKYLMSALQNLSGQDGYVERVSSLLSSTENLDSRNLHLARVDFSLQGFPVADLKGPSQLLFEYFLLFNEKPSCLHDLVFFVNKFSDRMKLDFMNMLTSDQNTAFNTIIGENMMRIIKSSLNSWNVDEIETRLSKLSSSDAVPRTVEYFLLRALLHMDLCHLGHNYDLNIRMAIYILNQGLDIFPGDFLIRLLYTSVLVHTGISFVNILFNIC